MPDYQLSKIYQLVCLTTGKRYIGATTLKTLAERLSGHNRHFKQWKNQKGHYLTSFIILEKNNYKIELVEAYPCNSKDELNAREAYHIKTTVCVNKSNNPIPLLEPPKWGPPVVTPDRLIERKLCLNQEFLNRTFFPVHKYNSRYVMVDIRDHYSPSLDKECSYPVI